MKIIVSSEAEKELMQRFINVVQTSDIISDAIKDFDNENTITSDELYFIENGFCDCELEIAKTYPMTQEHTVINGYCKGCGSEINGLVDGGDVSYEEYLEYLDKELYCEDCLKRESEE